jgi:hypothetical protein
LLVFRGSASVASGNVPAADFRRALEADGAFQGHQSWEKIFFVGFEWENLMKIMGQ